jgi:hypothetical protein
MKELGNWMMRLLSRALVSDEDYVETHVTKC